MTRRLRRCSIVLIALPLLGAALAAPAQAAPPSPVAAAAGWVSTQFADTSHLPAPDGDHFDNSFGPNYGENADAVFGLAAAKAGADKAAVALDYLDAHLADYADLAGAFGGPFDGSIAKLALARIVAGRSAADLLTMLKSDECAANATKCTPGSPASIFNSISASFVMLAEARAGGSFTPSAAAVDYFLSLQCADGGFTDDTSACGSGDAAVDATSYGIMALQALGGHATELDKAASWLVGQRNVAGYWISQSIPNTNSTGLATAALSGAGIDVSTSRAWLLDQQVPAGHPGAGALEYDGKFTPSTTSATSPSVLATAQGILGLADGGSLATVTASGSSAGVDLLAPAVTLSPDPQAIGTSATAHGAGFAAGEQVHALLDEEDGDALATGTADPSGLVELTFDVPTRVRDGNGLTLLGLSSGQEAHVAFAIEGGPGMSGSDTVGTGGTGGGGGGQPPLANTGTNASGLAGLGFAALVAGGVALALARQRRRGRHAA